MCPGFWWRTAAQESKKSAMFQPSEASSATAIHYGLCLSLVLSGKPRLGTAIWRNFWHGRIRKRQGATKEKLRHGLVRKMTWSWIVGKVRDLSRVLNLIDQPCPRNRTTLSIWRMEPLKDFLSLWKCFVNSMFVESFIDWILGAWWTPCVRLGDGSLVDSSASHSTIYYLS